MSEGEKKKRFLLTYLHVRQRCEHERVGEKIKNRICPDLQRRILASGCGMRSQVLGTERDVIRR